ncbi:glutathione S-transferase U25 [Citrus sinensis]|nr:glutathione S-transferase U25 [Citrus sinensis]
MCESTIIVNYIDETWPSPPLLPSCAYERAKARFWADFIDKKVFDAVCNIWKSKGEVPETAKNEFIEILKQLEGALGEKDFFGGDSFGFVDVIAIPLTCWFYAVEEFGGFKVENECPTFSAWMNKCMQRETVTGSFQTQKRSTNLLSC